MAALELGDYLIHTDDGELKLKSFIMDDIEHARQTGNIRHVKELEAVLKQFVLSHPKINTVLEKTHDA